MFLKMHAKRDKSMRSNFEKDENIVVVSVSFCAVSLSTKRHSQRKSRRWKKTTENKAIY